MSHQVSDSPSTYTANGVCIFLGPHKVVLTTTQTREDSPRFQKNVSLDAVLEILRELENADEVPTLECHLQLTPKLEIDVLLNHIGIRIRAAGGLVWNERDELLMIRHRGVWDLPKGWIDPGESALDAATREILEETGIQVSQALRRLPKTFHVYTEREHHDTMGQRKLKDCTWFEMRSQGGQVPRPQSEEMIEEARWVPRHQVHQQTPIYANIAALLNEHVGE